MRVGVFCVGRMKAGPERQLADRYFERFGKSGPSLGLEFSGVDEVAESRADSAELRRREEADRLGQRLVDSTALIALDERGKSLPSEKFAKTLAEIRDGGSRNLVLAIGGPDGHDESVRQTANLLISFGSQTWPHQLVRVMLAEQLYRAATILAGHPYHRG